MLIAVSFFLLLYSSRGTAFAPQPLFTCWYTDYEGAHPTTNLIFGYNNTESSPVSLSLNLSNDITGNTSVEVPLDDATHPYLFTVGYSPFAVVVRDQNNVLWPRSIANNNTIQWTINGTLTVVVNASSLISSTMCGYSSFVTQCPVWLPYFCGDESYCNGHEICLPANPDDSTGFCHRTTEIIICDNSSEYCSDEAQGCVVRPPSDAPTMAPTETTPPPTSIAPSLAPSEAPTSPAPTRAPSSAPTEVEELIELDDESSCTEDSNCTGESTFCGGLAICNLSSNHCVQANASYDPCSVYRAALDDYYQQINATSFPIQIACIEYNDLCVETFTCTQDSDCDDGLVCNGVEVCHEGLCYFQNNQSIAAICNSSLPMICIEPTGCTSLDVEEHWPSSNWTWTPHAPTNHTHPPDESASLVWGIVAGVLLGVGLIVLIVILYFEFSVNDSYVASITIAEQFNRKFLAAKMRVNLNYNARNHND